MKNYYSLLHQVLQYGNHIDNDRTSVGTLSLFGQQLTFDLQNNQFPLLSGKYTSFKLIAGELLWMLSGSTNNEDLAKICNLKENQDTIWKEWAVYDNNHSGELGPIYGHQWRSWKTPNGQTIDQIEQVIRSLIERPASRRHIVSAWNVADLPDETQSPHNNVLNGKMALAPCHCFFQFYTSQIPTIERARLTNDTEYVDMVRDRLSKCSSVVLKTEEYIINMDLDERNIPRYALSCQLYQRSSDLFLGLPYNIASYSLLTYMIAHITNMIPHTFIWTGGDCHIYKNHIEQVTELLSRDTYNLSDPKLYITNTVNNINDFKLSDFNVVNYNPLGKISAPVAV